MSASVPAPMANTADDPKAWTSLIKTGDRQVSLNQHAILLRRHTQERHGIGTSGDNSTGNETLMPEYRLAEAQPVVGETHCV